MSKISLAEIKILKAARKNCKEIAKIASENFSGLKPQKEAEKWIACNFDAFPRMQYFVAISPEKEIIGYILWLEKGGFRKESVFELEQIAVKKMFQGHGVGTRLIKESLSEVKNYVKKRGSFLRLVEVTTGTKNKAQNLYKKTLRVKPECVIKNLFRGNEVIMLARFSRPKFKKK